MKVCIIITLKLIFIGAAVYFFHDPARQTKTHPADTLCLQTETLHKLCAQCYKRDNTLPPHKGYHVNSSAISGVLKVESAEPYLTCNEYLQMVDFERDSQFGQELHLENLVSVQQVLEEVKGALSFHKPTYHQSEYIVEPQFNQFVLFKWASTQASETSVTSINTAYYQ